MAATTKASKEVTIDRRHNEKRRQDDKAESTKEEVTEATTETTSESEAPQGERRKVQRRRQIDPTTCERDYTQDEIEFMQALDDYKRRSGRMFPTCSEVLEVVRDLGYLRIFDSKGSPLHPIAEAFMVDVDEATGEVIDTDASDKELAASVE